MSKVMPSEWITEATTVEDIEAEMRRHLEQIRPEWIGTEMGVPGGMRHENWESFKTHLTEGRTIHRFDNNAWHQLAGRKGFVIMDGEAVINTYVEVLS